MTKNAEKRKQLMVLWKRKSHKGLPYLSGKDAAGRDIRGFYNINRENPKQPDVRIYLLEGEKIDNESEVALWVKVSGKGNQYLSGKYNGRYITGFINTVDGFNDKRPHVTIYYQDERQQSKKEDAKAEQETLQIASDDLPF